MARCKQNAPFVMSCLVKLSVVPVVNRCCLNGMGSWMKGKSGRFIDKKSRELGNKAALYEHKAPLYERQAMPGEIISMPGEHNSMPGCHKSALYWNSSNPRACARTYKRKMVRCYWCYWCYWCNLRCKQVQQK